MKMNKRLDLTEMATTWCDYGAFMDKFILQSTSSSHQIPLSGLTFAVKDIFDVEGYVTGFGNPDWARTHSPASSTAEVVSALLAAGAICVGKTIIDEMACSSSTNGENQHYGTPKNPCAADRVPGGSSSGSAVAVAAMLVDFSLGSDTGGSIRAPGSYCGIFGFRPSHGLVSTAGLISMAQSFDTVGWFARDPTILNRVGRVLLKLPATNPIKPTRFVVAKDCFELSSVPYDRTALVLIKAVEKVFGCNISYAAPGDYVKEKVPSLKHFMSQENKDQDHKIPSLAALSSAMQLLQKYEFKKNYGEWITTVNPLLGPGISERVWDAVRTTDEGIDSGLLVKKEPRASLREFLEDYGVFAILTLPGPPPVLQTDPSTLETFRAKAFSLLSIAGVSGFCQVIIPLGLHNNLPVSVSLLTRHGSDGFLLNVVETLYDTLKEQKALA